MIELSEAGWWLFGGMFSVVAAGALIVAAWALFRLK
jgi:hypothetical protein